MNRVRLCVLLTVLAICGCSPSNDEIAKNKANEQLRDEQSRLGAASSSALENVQKFLRDPHSAQFRNVMVFADGDLRYVICAEVNAKNGFGGYVGFRRFMAHVISTAAPSAPYASTDVWMEGSDDFRLMPPEIHAASDPVRNDWFAMKWALQCRSRPGDVADSELAALRKQHRLAVMWFESKYAASDGERGGTIYRQGCAACHATGVAGAPRLGDKAVWQKLTTSGTQRLYASAIKGKSKMPAKGGNLSLSDNEVRMAVDYMVRSAQ